MKWTIDKHYNSGSVTPGTVTFNSRREARAVAKDLSVSGVRLVARKVEPLPEGFGSIPTGFPENERRLLLDLDANIDDDFRKGHKPSICVHDCGALWILKRIDEALVQSGRAAKLT